MHTITFERSVTERVTIETDIAPGTPEATVLLAAKSSLKDQPMSIMDTGWRITTCEPPLIVHAIHGGRLLCDASPVGQSFVSAENGVDPITCPRCAELAKR